MPSTITSTDSWVYVEYNDYYTENLQSNQLHIAAFKRFPTYGGINCILQHSSGFLPMEESTAYCSIQAVSYLWRCVWPMVTMAYGNNGLWRPQWNTKIVTARASKGLEQEQVVVCLMCAGFDKSLLHNRLYACLFVWLWKSSRPASRHAFLGVTVVAAKNRQSDIVISARKLSINILIYYTCKRNAKATSPTKSIVNLQWCNCIKKVPRLC